MTEDTLQVVEKKVATDPMFSPEEAALIREVIATYRGLRFLGRAMRATVVTLGLIAGAIAAWDSLAARVKAWLGS
jgi:hypothetical protein